MDKESDLAKLFNQLAKIMTAYESNYQEND